MATQTYIHSLFEGGLVRIEFDVNDANWRVSQVRCINGNTHPAYARILKNGTEIFTAVAPAGATTSWNVTGVQLGWDTVNGGIMLGSYEIHAGWAGD